MIKRNALALLAVVAWTAGAIAGPVTEVALTGQPLQYTKGGEIDGCGVRLVGMPEPAAGQRRVAMLDVSFNLVNPGGGLVKGGLSSISIDAIVARDLSKTIEVPIKNVWLKAPSGTVTRPIKGKPLATVSHKHGLMYATELDPVLELVKAMRSGQPIQVGFHITAEDMERVYFGKVQLTEGETAQFDQCLDDWLAGMERRLRESPKQ